MDEVQGAADIDAGDLREAAEHAVDGCGDGVPVLEGGGVGD